MIVVGLVLAGIAAAFHVYVFFLESLAWTGPRARRIFGVRSERAAEIMKPLAVNQGFYNLFLAILALLGIVFFALGSAVVGATLVFAGCGSMVAAGAVLVVSSPSKARAAALQAGPPLLAIAALIVGLVIAG